MQFGNRLGEHTVMIAVQQSDTVRTDQCRPILLTGVKDTLLHLRTSLRLLTKACGDNDKCLRLLLLGKKLHRVRAELGRNDQNGEFCGRQFTDIMKNLHTLDLVLLGVDNTQCTLITTLQEVADNRTTWLVDIIRATDHRYRLRC